jgi:hypothetical protein
MVTFLLIGFALGVATTIIVFSIFLDYIGKDNKYDVNQ